MCELSLVGAIHAYRGYVLDTYGTTRYVTKGNKYLYLQYAGCDMVSEHE